jgi:hypothetical protein
MPDTMLVFVLLLHFTQRNKQSMKYAPKEEVKKEIQKRK